jgi:hypothetical protein
MVAMLRGLVALLLVASASAQAQDAAALRERHAQLKGRLANNAFGRALHVESAASAGKHKGEVYAVVEHPFAAVAAALARPAHWCGILTLQVNAKQCHAANEETLTALITRKARDPVDSAYRVDFRFDRVAQSTDYLHIVLNAPSGPVGTRDYQIQLEAGALGAGRTFMHLSYAYTLGLMARTAMDVYLAGAGRNKRGFSVEGGERGVVERAAMRYYLGVEAYLSSQKNLEARLRSWYTATARYPQLREVVDLEEYVAMKLDESRAALRLVDALR